MTARALIHPNNFPRYIGQHRGASQQRCGGHYATENWYQCAVSHDASDNSYQSISDILHRAKMRCKKFRGARAIEKMLAHCCYSSAFQLRNIQSIFVRLATLNSLLGCLLHVGKMACVTTASRFQSCERLALANSRRRDSGNQTKSQFINARSAA